MFFTLFYKFKNIKYKKHQCKKNKTELYLPLKINNPLIKSLDQIIIS